jgi:putative transposase
MVLLDADVVNRGWEKGTLLILASEARIISNVPFSASPRSPNLNPFAEAWVQRTKHEVLNHFIVFGERHLWHILDSWLAYYHKFRPHQGLGNVPISGDSPPGRPMEYFCREDIVCHEPLGGLLKHYSLAAA